MKYWLEWNRLIEEAQPALTYRIEKLATVDSPLHAILSLIGATPTLVQFVAAEQHYSMSANARERDLSIFWQRIPRSQLKQAVLRKAQQYGYTEDDLNAYCPHEAHGCHGGPTLDQARGQVLVHQKPEDVYFRTGAVIDGLVELYRYVEPWNEHWVEVGCGRGESGEIAAQFVGRLDCIDPFGEGFGTNEPYFDARTADIPNLHKVKLPSNVACENYQDGSLGGVYVDGMHDRKNVEQDLLCWVPKVRDGGWVAGHDYDDMDTHVGVVQAVDEVLGKPELRFQDSSFLFRKTPELTARVAAYREQFVHGELDYTVEAGSPRQHENTEETPCNPVPE